MCIGNLAGAEVSFFFLLKEVVLLGFGFGFGFFLAAILILRVAAGTAALAVTTFTAVLALLFAFAAAVAGSFTAHVLKLKKAVKASVEGIFFVGRLRQRERQ